MYNRILTRLSQATLSDMQHIFSYPVIHHEATQAVWKFLETPG